MTHDFRPLHINASAADFDGNAGAGRYLLLPGSRSRAEQIAEGFTQRTTKAHGRGHDLHLGVLERGGRRLDVGVISTGMGCPSVDLIVTELIGLGARTLVRVGTSGSLQPTIHTGDLVVATGAVRDEGTSDNYLPKEFPALADWGMLRALQRAVDDVPRRACVHFGTVHTKDSLYAREFGYGPLHAEHERYLTLLQKAGVCASEMECAHLFVLAQLGPRALGAGALGTSPVRAGAVLAVIGEHDQPFVESPRVGEAISDAIELALDGFVALSLGDLG